MGEKGKQERATILQRGLCPLPLLYANLRWGQRGGHISAGSDLHVPQKVQITFDNDEPAHLLPAEVSVQGESRVLGNTFPKQKWQTPQNGLPRKHLLM